MTQQQRAGTAPVALQYCQITATDLDESLLFYRDALGLELHKDLGAGVSRWVTLGSPAQPGLVFVLSKPHAGRSQADGDALQELLTRGVLPMIVFSTDDLDATFERVRASGAQVLQEPVKRPWGPRDSAFRDPSGNTVRIQQGAEV
jgi:catechol 2,3-dioxygenase-like lactoylglutathione lyase family enzyme